LGSINALNNQSQFIGPNLKVVPVQTGHIVILIPDPVFFPHESGALTAAVGPSANPERPLTSRNQAFFIWQTLLPVILERHLKCRR
jgi:hypothetical protein